MRFLDLGTLQLEIDGRLTAPGGRLPARALSVLLMNLNHRVSIDLLIDAVWGPDRSSAAAGTLESHIWRLRRVIEPGRAPGSRSRVLINDAGGYRLAATTDQVDSARFEQLCLVVVDLLGTGQPARALRAADEALALWRGTPFDELSERTWAAGPTARLQELQVQLLERRVDCILGIGEASRAIAELEVLLAAYPLRERLWSQRMLALYRTGRVEQALDTFRQARRTLREEIGLDPGRDLADLHANVLRRDPSLDVTVQRREVVTPLRPIVISLPRARPLIARQADQDAVLDALGSFALVTLAGPAGCGKTRLAIEAARAAAPGYPDGVWFVDLADAETAEQVSAAVIATLRLEVPAGREPVAAIAAHGRDRRMLLVLDNCEQALDAVGALCDDVLGSASQLSVLATSREPIGLADETVHSIGPLPLAAPAGAVSPAVHLLLERIGLSPDAVDAVHDIDAIDLAAAERVCRAVDGIPLAIELAAALAPTYALPEIAGLVESDPGRLRAIGRGQARHHQTLSSAIDRSHRLMTADEQLLHRRLSVLPAGFSRAMAKAVAPELEAATVPGLLARLVHRSMLGVTHPAGAPAVFDQLVPIRVHAARLLASAGESEQTADLRDLWTWQLAQRRPSAGRPEERQWYAEIEDGLATIRATLHRRLIARPDELGARIAPRLFGYWNYHGLIDEGLRWARAATQVAQEPEVLVSNQVTLACFLVLNDRHDEGRQVFDEALAALPSHVSTMTAKLLLLSAGNFAATGDADAAHRAIAAAEPSVQAAADSDLAVLAEAMKCAADSLTAGVEHTLARAERNYAAAIDRGNLLAAWMSCSSVNAAALQLRDPALGLDGSRRLLELQDRLSGRVLPHQLETFADFLAMAGRWAPAVTAFSACHYRATRAGSFFPRNQVSSELLADCRAALSVSEFDHAWAAGPTVSWTELVDPEPA